MKKVNIAIVGLHFGHSIIREQIITGYGSKHLNLVGVCDTDKPLLDSVAGKYGVKSYNTIDDVVKDPMVEVVGLYTGPNGRANLIRKIIRGGKDVVTTKPFETDPEQAQSVLNEANDLGRTVHLNSPAPTLPDDIRCIKNWQSAYNLGRAIFIQWHTWSTYRELQNNTWYDDPIKCPCAPIFRLGIYGISDILHFMSNPAQLFVMNSKIFTQRPTPDTAQLSIRFKDGAMASITSSFCVSDGNAYPDGMIMTFENGVVYKNTGPRTGYPHTDVKLEMQTVSPADKKPLILTETIPHHRSSGQYQWDILQKKVNGEPVQEDITPEMITDGIRIIKAMSQSELTNEPVFLC